MKKVYKIAAIVLGVIVLSCIAIWYYVFVWSESHHRNAAEEKGIAVTAAALVSAYEKGEKSSNALYLDKAVEVTGTIAGIKLNQAGKQIITLQSDDPMAGVMCTLKEKQEGLKDGTAITIKGICTGYLGDVVIIDAVIMNK